MCAIVVSLFPRGYGYGIFYARLFGVSYIPDLKYALREYGLLAPVQEDLHASLFTGCGSGGINKPNLPL